MVGRQAVGDSRRPSPGVGSGSSYYGGRSVAIAALCAPLGRRVAREKNMAGVILKDVVKVYENDVRIVDQFNMDIKDREFVILMSPSDCDKSTTLRMIAKLEKITS